MTKYGYHVHSVIVENRHGSKNIHGVSEEKIEFVNEIYATSRANGLNSFFKIGKALADKQQEKENALEKLILKNSKAYASEKRL